MSESILTIATPRDCVNCVLCHRLDMDRFICKPEGRFVPIGKRAEWCPLKPMPEKTDDLSKYSFGWNKCLEQIGGYNG